jgi:hypothetical protein
MVNKRRSNDAASALCGIVRMHMIAAVENG